jgi:transcription elongation factor Elf1
MSKETEVTTDGIGAATEPTFKRFEYGDLQMVCSHCGHEEVVEKGVKDGLQFVLPTTDEHKLKLVCSKCGVSLTMNFKESDEETRKEGEKKYQDWLDAQEKAKAKAEDVIEEAEDALLQEDTKQESVQDDN